MLRLLLVNFLFYSAVQCDDVIHVRTHFQEFIGQVVKVDGFRSKPSASVNQFTGIRYGQAPVEKQRFRKSKPTWLVSKPQAPIQAKRWGPSCQQQEGFLKLLNLQTTEASEDCLYLNVWSPSVSVNDTRLRPVLVWFHGGSFISDSGTRKLYDGSILSASSNVVVVTVNFRLDVFGFLYSGTAQAPGNFALWDQLLALEWVQDNIEFFNGDPNKVTIMGHNSGAISVALHLLSPLSRRLFQKAIILSGSPFTQMVTQKRSFSTEVSKLWLESASNKTTCSKSTKWTNETLRCLRESSIETLLTLSNPLTPTGSSPEVILGDEIFPFDSIQEAIDQMNSINRNTSILLGSTNDEGGLVLPVVNMETFSLLNPKSMTKGDAFAELAKLSSMLTTARGVNNSKVDGDEVSRNYLNKRSTTNNYAFVIGEAIGDFYVTCPITEFGRRVALNSNIHVYQYLWARKLTPNEEVPCIDWMGACHGSDLAMIFGWPFVAINSFTEEERQLSMHMMRTIGHFAHHG